MPVLTLYRRYGLPRRPSLAALYSFFVPPALFYATWHGRRRVFAEPTQLQTWAYIVRWSCIFGATVKPPTQTKKSLYEILDTEIGAQLP